jgi:hypothetical protein
VRAEPTPAELATVRALLGREPQGRFTIAARDAAGEPAVIRNAPLLDDGTPMPTLYWLIAPDEIRRIGRLEADGGVDAAEAAVGPDALRDAHDRYAAERDAEIPPDHAGPRPYGGVGGTRTGVKCLHAHWAWHLAGGDDPVGRWIEAQLADRTDEAQPRRGVHITIYGDRTTIAIGAAEAEIPWGVASLTEHWLAGADPPSPGSLTNALGAVDDHLDDVEREHPHVLDTTVFEFSGEAVTALARLEAGKDDVAEVMVLSRQAAEEIFRIVATEPAADRAHNPGLPFEHVGTIVATCCIVLAVMRRLHLDQITLLTRVGAATDWA